MSNNKLNARVTLKHDIEANWLKAINFIPFEGEIIIYCKEEEGDVLPEGRTNLIKYDRIKIGDGITNVNDLPFLKAESDVLEKSAEGGYTIGKEEDNLETISEHSVISGRNIKAGIRGLKISATTVHHEPNDYLVVTTIENPQDFYNKETGLVTGETRASLVLNHHSFEQFKVVGIIGHDIHLLPIVEGSMAPDDFYALHGDNKTRNYLWLYNVEERYGMRYFNIDINKNCPVRPEADYIYALGDNIKITGRSSFSSGAGNQNMGWYSATMGRNNTAYYAAFALGAENEATGTYAVALNQNTKATAVASLSKGYKTEATANYSEAGGLGTKANYMGSFAHGRNTITGRNCQTVVGEYNKVSNTALFVVGNGYSEETGSILINLPITSPINIGYPLKKGSLSFTKTVPMGSMHGTTENVYYSWSDADDQTNSFCTFDIDYDNGVIRNFSYEPKTSSIGQPAEFNSFELHYTKLIGSNALEIEKDGSATIGKTGDKENSVATKGYVDAVKTYTENTIEEIIQAPAYSYLVKNYAQVEKCELNKPHDGITITNNVVTCTDNTFDARNQYRAQVSNNYANKYKNLNYELIFKISKFDSTKTHDGLWFKFVDYTGTNKPVAGAEGWGMVLRENNYVLAHIIEDGFDYVTEPADYPKNIHLNSKDEFKLEVKLNDSILTVTLTNMYEHISGSFTYDLGKAFEYIPSLAIGFRFVKAEVRYNIFSDEYVSLTTKTDYADKFNNYVMHDNNYIYLETPTIDDELRFASGNLTLSDSYICKTINNSIKLKHNNIIRGSVTMFPVSEGGIQIGGNYIISGTDILHYESKEVWGVINYDEGSIIWKNDGRPLYIKISYSYNADIHFTATKTGFENLVFNESSSGENGGVNPQNSTKRYITYSNDYVNSYGDFLFKVDIDLKNIYQSSTGIAGATGPIIYLFDGNEHIQIRQYGTIVTGFGGYITNISVPGINTVGQYTLYFKYLKSVGILNIYKDSLDNLITSIQLTSTEMTTLKPQLAFGGRCCTYSVECEIHKADYEIKPITQAQFDGISKKDPYRYYMIEE